MNINLYTHIGTKLDIKEDTTNSISESFKLKEMQTIYSKLISDLKIMISAENAYYDAKDKLVDELPIVMCTENYDYGEELSNNVNNAIVNIQRIYRDAQIDVERLITLTEISDIKFEKKYIFEFSKDRTEMSIITGLKLLEQYLSN